MVGQSGGIHPTGYVESISPNVVLWLPGADDAGYDRPDVHADPQREIIVGILVDAAEQFLLHDKDEFDERCHEVERGHDVGVRLGLADTHVALELVEVGDGSEKDSGCCAGARPSPVSPPWLGFPSVEDDAE